MSEETVTISKAVYDSLMETQGHMYELEARGVDNWIGYVGPSNYCYECDKDVSWAEEKCPECGEEMDEGY